MGELRGFMNYPRVTAPCEPALKRRQHFREFVNSLEPDELRKQGSRCMDCGVPFCHNGCPLGNIIPEFNHLTSEAKYKDALQVLLSTNNFPEFTGRICPAPCESSCVLGINADPVAIESIEMALADMGFQQGWIQPEPPSARTGFKVAIVGSGPAGLAAAQQLNRHGHHVVVYEKQDRPGGLLMYGIPDFKLEKEKVSRRITLLENEGIVFRCKTNVGKDVSLPALQDEFDAILLAWGSAQSRDLNIEGRDNRGIYFAYDYLKQSTRRLFGEVFPAEENISAAKKDVIVIGGGDTGADCVGTANRQGAKSVTQFEILAKPPQLGKFPRAKDRPPQTPWPQWPYIMRTSTSHEEGCERQWSVQAVKFEHDSRGNLTALITKEIEWKTLENSRREFHAKENSEKRWPCQLALLAIGFTGPEQQSLLEAAGIQMNTGGCVGATDNHFETSIAGVFAAGDMRRGQSLVVWAIAEGRQAAESIHHFLSNKSNPEI